MSKAVLVFEFDAEQSAEIGQALLGKVLSNGVSGAIDSVKALAKAPIDEVSPAPLKAEVSEKPKKVAKATAPAPAVENWTLESVRELLQDLREKHDGFSLSPLFAKFGAVKLSGIDSADYPALIAEAKSLCK